MDYSSRPARKQGKGGGVGPSREDRGSTSEINIWYGKRTSRDEKEAKAASTRCKPKLDCGYTRGRKGDAICVFFAQGRCTNGPECDYLHKLPDEEDEKILGPAVDIFGRDRFAEERNDMGGVGTFSRENRTLYVGRVIGSRKGLVDAVKQQFGEFGEIESSRVLEGKNCAFVKYRLRASAEFAKEAMACQSLSPGDPPINLRWATEDPNPGVKKRDLAVLEAKAKAHLEAQGVCLAPAEFNYPMHYQLPASNPTVQAHAPLPGGNKGAVSDYPDTSHQFARQPALGAPPPPPPGRPGGGWVRYLTAEGYPYFYNQHTHVTAWELPAGETAGLTAQRPTQSAGAGQAPPWDHDAQVVFQNEGAVVFETDPAAYADGCGIAGGAAGGGGGVGAEQGASKPAEEEEEKPEAGLLGLAQYGESDEDEDA